MAQAGPQGVIICNKDGQPIGTLHADVPPYPTFRVAAYPPLKPAYIGDEYVPDAALTVPVVTFERGRWTRKGKDLSAVRVVGGEDHVGDVQGFIPRDVAFFEGET